MKLLTDNQILKLKKPKQFNSYLKYSGLAIQMAVTIYLGNLLGEYVDKIAESGSDIYSKIITLLAVFLSIFVIIRQVIKSQE
jgi:membrane protein DedA with SNARE-associated domain